MIELTELQLQAISAAGQRPAVVVDPQTKTPYVLLRQDLYERLKKDHDYDDNSWTDEEMELLAWEAGKQAGWEEMGSMAHDWRSPMSIDLKTVTDHALSLPPKQRERLAEKLWQSLEDSTQQEVQEAWMVEIRKRIEELRNGSAKTIPGEKVMDSIRKKMSKS